MKIAIAVHTVDANASEPAEPSEQDQCFAEFEVNGDEASSPADDDEDDDDVQVTVVLRGKRGELEDPARGMTELVLRALEARRRSASRDGDVIDVAGVAVDVAQAAG